MICNNKNTQMKLRSVNKSSFKLDMFNVYYTNMIKKFYFFFSGGTFNTLALTKERLLSGGVLLSRAGGFVCGLY